MLRERAAVEESYIEQDAHLSHKLHETFNEIRKLNFKAWQAIWYIKPLQGTLSFILSQCFATVTEHAQAAQKVVAQQVSIFMTFLQAIHLIACYTADSYVVLCHFKSS